ncbi:(Fe-S)-binding protein [Thermodesulfobacteriota bacterium]
MTTTKKHLRNISLIYMAPCVITDNNVRFEADLSDSVKDVMPYLNAIIKNASYNPEKDTIFFSKGQSMITLTDKHLAVARALDQTDAFKIIDFIKEQVNYAHYNIDSIEPVYEKKVRTTAFEIFSYLPRTNCKVCGEPTCLAFAVKLLMGEQNLSACIPIMTDEKFIEHKKEMQALTEALGF